MDPTASDQADFDYLLSGVGTSATLPIAPTSLGVPPTSNPAIDSQQTSVAVPTVPSGNGVTGGNNINTITANTTTTTATAATTRQGPGTGTNNSNAMATTTATTTPAAAIASTNPNNATTNINNNNTTTNINNDDDDNNVNNDSDAAAGAASGGAGSSTNPKKRPLEDRKARDRKRILRNRQLARVSNERRKGRIRAMENELTETKQTVSTLEESIRCLEEENRELRNLLQGKPDPTSGAPVNAASSAAAPSTAPPPPSVPPSV